MTLEMQVCGDCDSHKWFICKRLEKGKGITEALWICSNCGTYYTPKVFR